MRANLKLKFEGKITMPIQYNNIIQSVILKWIGNESYQKFIHDVGYQHNNRRYKMYTFSRLQGKFKMNRSAKTITYFDEANLIISSADDVFLNYVVNNILIENEFKILNQSVYVDEITCSNRKIKSREKIYTKSPIVVYSTFENEGNKKTYYYSPYEDDFAYMLKKNLINKYNAAYDKDPDCSDFFIKPTRWEKLKENVVVYKGTIIKGWSGEFIIEGSDELLNIAYNAGLGSKNAQGFGCIEICSS